MFIRQKTSRFEIERSGREYGGELAAALVLASRQAGVDNELKRQMSRIVLREIATEVRKLRDAALASDLVAAYEFACRAGVREELEKSLAADAERARHAA